jgi:hypothetical protein
MSTYLHCSLGGFVCTICQYAINFSLKESMVTAITRHERNSKNHVNVKTSPDEIPKLVSKFNEFVETVSGTLYELKKEEANKAVEYLKTLLHTEKLYDLCDCCKVLVKDKEKHFNKLHIEHFNKQQTGMMSQSWKSKNPKIYNCNISLVENIDSGIFCQSIVQAIDKVPINTNRTNQISNNYTLQNILHDQEKLFTQNEERITIQVNNQQTNPDLWVFRNGWDSYFENCNVQDIADVTEIPANGSINYIIEQQFKEHIMHAIEYVKSLDPNHVIFWDIKKRPGPDYLHPNKPFRLPNMITFERYVRTLLSIIRVILY